MIRPQELRATLAKETPRVLIAGGAEELLRSECRAAFVQAIGADADVLDLSWGESDALDDITAVFDELRAASLFGAPRLISIRNGADFLAEAKDGLTRIVESGEMAAYLWLEDESFVKKFGKSVSTPASVKTLVENGAIVIDCSPLSSTVWGMRAPWEHELGRWLVDRAKDLGARLSLESAHALCSLEGGGMRALVTQIERLALAAGPGSEITTEMIEESISGTKEANVFDIVDAAAEGRIADVLKTVRRLFEVGVSENQKRRIDPAGLVLRLMPLMTQRFHQLGRVRELERQGESFESAAAAVWGESKRWLFGRYQKQCAVRTPRALGDLVIALEQAEYAVKTGADPRMALEAFFVNHCRPSPKAAGARA